MGKAIVIGIAVVLVIVATLAAAEMCTNKHDKKVGACAIFMICCITLCVFMIVGGIGYF